MPKGFDRRTLEQLAETSMVAAVNQIELHPDRDAEEKRARGEHAGGFGKEIPEA